nr:EOG090X089S [Ilyocryptus agilis]
MFYSLTLLKNQIPVCLSRRLFDVVSQRTVITASKRFAARKGTRERKEKKKVKAEVTKKEEFVPYRLRMANLKVPEGPQRLVEVGKPEAIDDVFVTRHFMSKTHSLANAIQYHRETNDPTIYNSPDSLISVKVELDMKLEKKNRFLEDFSRILLLPHLFNFQPRRKILALCKTQETQEEAKIGGADAVGGLDLIKRIQSGEVALSDYEYYIAHPNIATETLALRGLMRKRLPNARNGSMGTDLAKMIERFSLGIEFSVTKSAHELDYGVTQVPFGRLSMTTEELEANFATILKDIETCRGRVAGNFITRCFVVAPPSPEYFVVDSEPFVGRKEESSSASSSSDSESDDEAEKPEDVEDGAPGRRASAS